MITTIVTKPWRYVESMDGFSDDTEIMVIK